MIGLGWKVSAGLVLAGVAGWGWMDYQLTQQKLEVARLMTANVILQENAAKLQSAVDSQKETMNALIKQQDKNGDRLYALGQQLNVIQQEAGEVRLQLDSIRQTEGTRVLENPFSRGDAAFERVNHLLQSISGKTAATKS